MRGAPSRVSNLLLVINAVSSIVKVVMAHLLRHGREQLTDESSPGLDLSGLDHVPHDESSLGSDWAIISSSVFRPAERLRFSSCSTDSMQYSLTCYTKVENG